VGVIASQRLHLIKYFLLDVAMRLIEAGVFPLRKPPRCESLRAELLDTICSF
jgi:hypothetical protein